MCTAFDPAEHTRRGGPLSQRLEEVWNASDEQDEERSAPRRHPPQRPSPSEREVGGTVSTAAAEAAALTAHFGAAAPTTGEPTVDNSTVDENRPTACGRAEQTEAEVGCALGDAQNVSPSTSGADSGAAAAAAEGVPSAECDEEAELPPSTLRATGERGAAREMNARDGGRSGGGDCIGAVAGCDGGLA